MFSGIKLLSTIPGSQYLYLPMMKWVDTLRIASWSFPRQLSCFFGTTRMQSASASNINSKLVTFTFCPRAGSWIRSQTCKRRGRFCSCQQEGIQALRSQADDWTEKQSIRLGLELIIHEWVRQQQTQRWTIVNWQRGQLQGRSGNFRRHHAPWRRAKQQGYQHFDEIL